MKPGFISVRRNDAGFSIIENLVAIAILGVATVATVPLLRLSFSATGASRTEAAVISEIEGLVSEYRTQPYVELLQRIATTIPSINDGDSVQETIDSENGRATIVVTFTAIKTQATGAPEGVRIHFAVTQRRNHIPDGDYTFETIITQVS